jgi:hypothetical protein
MDLKPNLQRQNAFVVQKKNLKVDDFKYGAIEMLLDLMEFYELYDDMSGLEKRELVLENLRLKLDPDTFERYEPIFNLLIEFIVGLSRKEVIIALNKAKKCKKVFSCCQ